MPVLESVRIVGVELDEGKKVIPDITWNLNGKNMLFLLENGGGKTSYIQLLLQTILPNSTLSGRELKNTLAKKSYGHIVTSWKMDGDNPKYLCTGFSFNNAEGDKDSLDYYTYMFEYKEDSELTLKTLPLKQNGRITKYREYKAYLNKLEKPIVKVYDTVISYKQDLKMYGILPEEWESIRKINGEEGGVSEFFEKAKTTKNLLEKLLIPTIEDTIFQGKEGKNEIIRAYQSYKENLLQIPDTQKDLQDFKLIKDKANAVYDAVSKFTKDKATLTLEYKNLQRLQYTFLQNKEMLTIEVVRIKENLEKLIRTQQELGWKIDSYEVHKNAQKILEQQQLLAKVQKELAYLEEAYKKKSNELATLKAMVWYEKYAEAKRAVNEHNIQIDLLSKNEPELMNELNNAREKLQNAWSFLMEEKEEELVAMKQDLKYLEGDRVKRNEELSKTQQVVKQLENKIAKLEKEKDDYSKDKQKLEQEINKEAALNPEGSLETLKEEFVTIEHSIENITKKLEQMKQESKELREKSNALVQKLYEQDNLQGKVIEKIERYTEDLVLYKKSLAPFNKQHDDVFENKSSIEKFLENKITSLQKVEIQLIHEIESSKKQIKRLEENESFVPHEDLIGIKGILEQHNVYTVLGSEWLSEQVCSDAEKEAILSQFPLLPYSFLVEESQLASLKRVLEKIKDATTEIPLLFQIKSHLTLGSAIDAAESLHHLNIAGSLVYQSLNVELFTSRELIESLIISYKEKINEKNVELVGVKDEIKLCNECMKLGTDFYTLYEKETEKEYLLEKQQSEKTLKTLIEAKGTIEHQLEEIEKKEVETNSEREAFIDRKGDIALIIQMLSSFIERYPNPIEMLEKLDEFRVLREKELSLIKIIEEEIDEINSAKDKKNKSIWGAEQSRKLFESEGLKCELVLEHEPDDCYTNDEYVDYMNKYKVASDQLSGKIKEIEQLRELLKIRLNIQKMAETEIINLKRTPEEIGEVFRVVSQSEIARFEEEVREQQEKMDVTKKIVGEYEIELKGLKSTEKTLKDNILKYHGHVSNEVFLYGVQGEEEYEVYKHEEKTIKQEIDTDNAKLHEKNDTVQNIEKGLALLIDLNLVPDEEMSLFSDIELRVFGESPLEIAKWLKQKHKSALESFNTSKSNVDKAFENYNNALYGTNNAKAKKVARDIDEMIVKTNKMYDVEFVLEVFTRFFDAIEQLEKHMETQLKELEKDKENLVHLSYQRARTMYENIIEIPKHSKVELYGRQMQLIKISWNCEEEETAKENIRRFINELLSELQIMKKDGATEEEIEKYTRGQLSIIKLLGNLADIEKCNVQIFKPRKETMVQQAVDYYQWDKAAHWSGGEGYTSYMTMFMILITHIRKKTTAQENVKKTILADNPFGKASSNHVVQPMIELAAKNKIQLFCLTAIKEEGIRAHFDVITSNRYYAMGGKELLRTEHQDGINPSASEKIANLTVNYSYTND